MDTSGWIKLYRKLPEDAKVRKLSASKRWIFVCYILMARHEGKFRGYLVDEEGEVYSQSDRANYCGIDKSGICRHDKELIEVGLLEEHANGKLKIKNYEKYQGKGSEDVAKTQSEPLRNRNDATEPVANIVANFGASFGAKSQQMNSTSTPIRSKEEKNINTAAGHRENTPAKPFPVAKTQMDEWTALAMHFRKHYPSLLQGRVETTINQLKENYEGACKPADILKRIDEHRKAGTRGLKPWNIMTTPIKVKPIERTVEENDFAILHGHYPDQLQEAAKCPLCQRR